MVPVLTRPGRSFKGAAAYYLHDKRQEGEAERLTGDRVAWVETVNLQTADPERAWRRMAATAMSQVELKKAAGVPLTGQKLKSPVLAYSLAWHESDRPTREQQIEAARESLKALGMDDRQAMIIAHKDTPHPHVHILVNRVSPENGIAADLENSFPKIQAWASDYQKRHGQTHCPQREENARKRQQGQKVFTGRDSRKLYEFRKAVGNDSLKADFILAEQRQRDAQLYNQGRALKDSHGRQWESLKRTYDAGREKLETFERQRVEQAKAETLASHGPQWDALRTRQREEVRRVEAFRAVARENGEKIAADPIIALTALTRQQATFTRADIARFVNQHSDDRRQMAEVVAKVEASPELVRLGHDENGRERFTTREMMAVERRMIDAADRLAASDGHRVGAAAQDKALRSRQLGEEQAAAFRHVTGKGDLACVVGYAGTGKSTMLDAAREVWERQGFTVKGAALSGIAAENLEGGSGIESRTVASLEYAWQQGRDGLTSRDVLVIDEAGMIDSRRMERMLSAAQQAGAKVVLVGDPAQLQAIEAGAAFRAIGDRHGRAEITEVRRQREGWQREATKDLAEARTGAALQRYDAAGMVKAHDSRDDARAALVDGWNADWQAAPGQSRIILAYTRADVAALNGLAREKMRESGLLGADREVRTEQGKRVFAAGDRLMFLRNDRDLGVKNGTLGTVERAGLGLMTVRLDGADGRKVTFALKDYGHVAHGYASTVHKAQGVTVDKAHVLASPYMDRHAAYVAMTRHREGVRLHYGRDDFRDGRQLAKTLGRDRAKDSTLDYQAGIVAQGQEGGGSRLKGLLCAVFNPGERRAALDKTHRQERQDLGKSMREAFRRQVDAIRQETGRGLSKLRREFEARGAVLAQTQETGRADLKDRWNARADERRAEFPIIQKREPASERPEGLASEFGQAGKEMTASAEEERSRGIRALEAEAAAREARGRDERGRDLGYER